MTTGAAPQTTHGELTSFPQLPAGNVPDGRYLTKNKWLAGAMQTARCCGSLQRNDFP